MYMIVCIQYTCEYADINKLFIYNFLNYYYNFYPKCLILTQTAVGRAHKHTNKTIIAGSIILLTVITRVPGERRKLDKKKYIYIITIL